MKKQNQPRTKCLTPEKVQSYFSDVANLITSGSDEIIVSSSKENDLSFMVGRVRVRICTTVMRKEVAAL